MSDDYRTITFMLRSVQERVIVVSNAKSRGHGTCTIPRSLLSGIDDLKLTQLDPNTLPAERTMRLREWKAEELGFA
jgi:hypothetical protein